jgi:D-tyrosyl-tRNA(Tyr) deacylase
MKVLLQRVSEALVSVDGEVVGRIGQGLVVLMGVEVEDTEADAQYLADKIANLRIFNDADSKFNLSVQDIKGEILVVSQFTLCADTRKGRRPSFTDAALPDKAEPLIKSFVELLRSIGLRVETGRFQAHMLVEIHNDGPVTISLESHDRFRPRRG